MSGQAAAAGIGAAGSIAGSLLGGGNDGGTQTTQTQIHDIARRFRPYQNAFMERQYNLSNQPFQAYPGFFQQMAQAYQDEAAASNDTPWARMFAQQQGQQGGQYSPAFVDKKSRPFNPLTAAPGERLPLPIGGKELDRYQQAIAQNANYQPQIMNQKQFNDWKKTNGKMAKYADKPFVVADDVFRQYMGSQAQQQIKQPNILDEYLSSRSLKGFS